MSDEWRTAVIINKSTNSRSLFAGESINQNIKSHSISQRLLLGDCFSHQYRKKKGKQDAQKDSKIEDKNVLVSKVRWKKNPGVQGEGYKKVLWT